MAARAPEPDGFSLLFDFPAADALLLPGDEPPPLQLQALDVLVSDSQPPAGVAADARRKRHNANERRRTNALKSRLVAMREELARLEAQRAALAAAPRDAGDRFLRVVASIDRLRGEHAQLRARLTQWDMLNSTYQTIVSEFGPDSSRRNRQVGDDDDAVDDDDDTADVDVVDGDANGDDDAPIFQKVLFEAPMPLADALACVRHSVAEILEFRAQRQFESLGGEVFGWRDKRLLDAHSLQFMLAQRFAAALPPELVYKTWNLLTTLRLYRRIQPATTALRVLQRVTSDCVIARLSVGAHERQHHSILLIARGRIDGGFLITYRSIPLSPAQQRFAETDGAYVTIFNWFMFLDTPDAPGACDVSFGGKVRNRSAEYLRYLMLEVVAGVVRWQTAVGLSKFHLTN